MKKRGIILILSSHNVDTYINVLCSARFDMEIRNISFLHITDLSAGIKADEVEAFREKIIDKIKRLSIESKVYEILNSSISIGEIIKTQEEEINLHLKALMQSLGGSDRCIVDITTTTKAASQLLLANCLIHGYKNLYEFQLHKIDRNPVKNLYHNLKKENYSYIHLSDIPTLRRAYKSLARQASLSLAAIAVSIIILLVSVSWAASTTVTIASALAAAASLATLLSLGLQVLQMRR